MRKQTISTLSAFASPPISPAAQQSISLPATATPPILPAFMPSDYQKASIAPSLQYSEFLTLDLRYFLVQHYLSPQDALALSAVDKNAFKERFSYPQLQQLSFKTEIEIQQFLQCCQQRQESIHCTGAIRTREDFYSIKKLILTLTEIGATKKNKHLFKNLREVTTLEINIAPTQSLASLSSLLKAARYLPLQHLSIAYPAKQQSVVKEDSLPSELWQWPMLKTLTLKGCIGIGYIPEEIGKLTQLTSLHVSVKRIIPSLTLPNSLAQLTKLNILTLENFTAVFPQPETLGQLNTLQSLTLTATKLPLQYKILNRLSHLESLHLTGGRGAKLFDDFNKVTVFQRLKSLELNRYAEHPARFITRLAKLTRLKKLVLRDFCGYGIEDLPEEIGQLKGLTTLKLGDLASIRTLPDSLKNLKLKKLSLTNFGSMNVLSDVIGQITTLEILKLRYIEFLSGLPESIGNLKNLTVLSLHGVSNGHFVVPEEIGQLQNLKILRLDNVDFDTLPDSLWNLAKLEKFILSSAFLENISEKIGQLTTLTSLKLACYINTLPNRVWNLTNLENLSLSAFDIQHISEKITQLQGLKSLTLKNLPKLQTLPDGLQELKQLKHLVLKDVSVASLPERRGFKITQS
jgi:hypothetical protein